MARALISALAVDDLDVYASLSERGRRLGFNGLELAGDPDNYDMHERVAWK